MQQAALNPGKGTAEWLAAQQLSERPPLAAGLRVEAGWELAVETVLGADLQAVLLDDEQQLNSLDLQGFSQGDLRLALPARGGVRVPGSLLDKVEASVDLAPWLAQVKPVPSLASCAAATPSVGAWRKPDQP